MNFWGRLAADFWPPDNSRVAPNLVASTIATSVAFMTGWLLKGKGVVKGLHAKLDRHHAEQLDAHRTTHSELDRTQGGDKV